MDYKVAICTLIGCIEQNIKGKPDYHKMEQTLGFSYRHIRSVFKKTTQISLSRYILARKIANAAFELRHSNKSITDIAYDHEFSNPDTFTRAFRRDTGLTPSAFRKSGHQCGRRIICPGVYAPVILDLTNPRFTLPKLMEVNTMGEMKKTIDSCVLYGVPKVYYGRKDGELSQGTPFPMCLQSVLNYMGQNISYIELMAYSGAAFRMRWDVDGWNLGAVDIRFTYEDHLRPFELGFKGAGRSYVISENPDKPKSVSKPDAIALIKAELDCGRPLIALGVVGPPEACIVTGYRDNGETLLGWSLFQGDGGGLDEFSGDCKIDESGYFIKTNWWESTEAIMSIGEDIGHRTPVKEVLSNALMLMTQSRVSTYGGNQDFYGGQAAYEAWAKALEDDASFTDDINRTKNADTNPTGNTNTTNSPSIDEIGWCQGDAETMLGEGRSFASAYMHMLANQHPAIAQELNDCARLLGDASMIVVKMWEARKKNGLKDKQVRSQLAALVRQAAQYENDACLLLTQIVDKL